MNNSENFIRVQKSDTGRHRLIIEEFDGLNDLVRRVKNTDLYGDFFNYRKQSHQSSRDDYSDCKEFYGTADIDEAYRLARDGNPSDLQDVPDLFVTHFKGIMVKKYTYGVHGLTIDVGRHLSGRPDSWLQYRDSEEVSTKGKIKRILVGGSFLGGVSTKQIKNRASAIMAIVDVLEHLGYRVAVDILYSSDGVGYSSKGPVVTGTVLHAKQPEQALNRERMIFAMNPTVFRRFIFAVREQLPQELGEALGAGTGYGSTISTEKYIAKHNSKLKKDYDLIIGDQNNMRSYKTIESSIGRAKEILAKYGIELDETK